MKLFLDGPATGRENMARDAALLAQGKPALRLYRWDPPCVSVGYFQNTERDIDADFLAAQGIDLVRRPSGGRAVLHHHELTYALVLPETMLPPGVVLSYRKIARALIAALDPFGLDCELRGPDGRPDRGAGCFSSASAWEIRVRGRKLVGSAQVRKNGAVLQHGSLLLSVDYERQARCLKGPAAAAADVLKGKMIGLDEALGRPVAWREAAEILARRFPAALDASN